MSGKDGTAILNFRLSFNEVQDERKGWDSRPIHSAHPATVKAAHPIPLILNFVEGWAEWIGRPFCSEVRPICPQNY